MNNSKGFTLIELLTVIVTLAFIGLISTPIVLKVIENTRKEAYKNSSLGVLRTAEIYESKNDFISINEDGINIS